jgi:hypothetical protein
MMDSFFSILPMGLFGHKKPNDVSQPGGSVASPVVVVEELEQGRKRPRECDRITDKPVGSSTPTLLSRRGSEVPSFREEDDVRPVKRFRGPAGIPLTPPVVEVEVKDTASTKSPLSGLPEDVLAHCLSFLNSTEDRSALQCTSRQFRRISNSDEMLIGVQVGGDCKTGLHGMIQEEDTPDTAADKLMPFAMSGNLEAVYM